jgi:DNA-directed RNA polymerase specialized sigma24 family protein
MEVLVQQPDLSVKLRIAARQVWQQIPLGMRIRIAVHRMLAQIHKGVGEAIVVILADHGFHVPRDERGRVDLKDPSVAKLGNAIYQKIRGVVRNQRDIEDIMHDTFKRVFLEQKSFLRLRGDTFEEYRGWILTAFHNAARDFVRKKGEHIRQQRTVPVDAQDPDRPDDHKKLEMIESQLRSTQRVPWERHPMWRQVKQDVFRALGEFDRKERSSRPPGRLYDFPTKRVFELMVLDGLSAQKAAERMVEEGSVRGDPSQIRHALKRLKNRMEKVVQAVVDSIEDRELLDSFFDAIAA